MREEILRILKNSGDEYVSGEEISKRLGVTRAAVWKHMQALQEEGLEIEAVTRKGYRLKRGARFTAPLRGALVEPHLNTRVLGRNAVFLESAPSSNLIARQLAAQGCAHGTIVIVEEQTEGRGRRGRGWVNAPGKDICVSAVLRPHVETQQAPRFTLATALGVYRLAASLGLVPDIKWPNDVLIEGKKICGILLELQGSMEQLESLVVGFGVNVNTEAFPEALSQSATSLCIAGGKPYDRAEVLASLVNELEPLFDACEQDESYAKLLEDYRRCCGTLHKEISVTGVTGARTGIAEGIDELGRLLLRLPDGSLEAVAAGDVTLRR